jgi:hypothetical protein
MTIAPSVTRFLLLLGLGFFFGLAFERFHARANQARPGGVRSFPLLALIGALLYQLDPNRLITVSVGLLVLAPGSPATTGATSMRPTPRDFPTSA